MQAVTYTSPRRIVAQIAFDRGWKRWVQPDPPDFIGKLHPDLISPFLDRVRVVASDEVKAAMADTFREWISTRRTEDLADPSQVDRLTTFVETDPYRYLPLFRNLILDAPANILRAGNAYGRSPRRQIVWLCERLAAFPNLYEACEEILFRLATEESEPSIGNNATGIWCHLQRIYLSGSSVSFLDRFQILRDRTATSTGAAFDLCAKAIDGIFQAGASRMGAPLTVGGRLRPEDWQPQTGEEYRECWLQVLQLLEELSMSTDSAKSAKARAIVTDNLFRILQNGFLGEVRQLLAREFLYIWI